MITRDDVRRLKDRLLQVLEEDAHNADRLLSRLDAVTRESGVGAHAALLLILSRQPFEEQEARRHWEAIVDHRARLSKALGRDVGIRVALLDYFVHVNRRLLNPTLIDLEMLDVAERTAAFDPVTGLQTERAFRAAVQNELRRARRYGGSVSVVLFDLDDFEKVNRAAGHLIGDRILRETGILLKNKSRDIDLTARPGEDELALVLPETDRNGALLVAERFRVEVERHFSSREVAGHPAALTVSGGVAAYPEDAHTPEILVERAARALYRAKAGGKNAIHVFHPERRQFLRFELEPGRFEVEVLAPRDGGRGPIRDLSRHGIVFTCPEPLEVGEVIEIRLQESARGGDPRSLRARGRVVRLEELPDEVAVETEDGGAMLPDRYEVGVALDAAGPDGSVDLLDFLEQAHVGRSPRAS